MVCFLIALFGDGLLQGRNFARQLRHKCFQIEIRQIIEGMRGSLDHRSIGVPSLTIT